MDTKINFRDHMGLVHMVANQHKRRCTATVQYEDLVQVGTMGLLKAIDKYDPTGCKFSTYAVHWIRDAIQQELDSHSRTIHIPKHAVQKARKAETPYTLSGQELTARIEPTITPDPETTIDNHLLYSKASKAMLQHLNGQQQLVIRLRSRDMTFQEIADQMGVSKGRVFHIESAALTILRKVIDNDE